MQCLIGSSLPILAELCAVENWFEKYNYMQYTMGAFEFSIFDFSGSFVYLKTWPFWPPQKNEAPRNSTTSDGRGGLVSKSWE